MSAGAGPANVSGVQPLARSLVYRALADAFRYPERDGVHDVVSRIAASVGGELGGPLASALAELAGASRAVPLDRAREGYHAVFGHVTLPDCPLYETACGPTDPFQQAQALADLQGFYRAFGVEPGEEAHERADHLAVELEFMHYLAFREAYALERHGAERAETLRIAQRRFLEEHLGRWAPVVARAVAARAGEPLAAAARALEQFLRDEAARLGAAAAVGVEDEEDEA